MFVEFSPFLVTNWSARVTLSNGLPIALFTYYNCKSKDEARKRFRTEERAYYQKAKELS